MTMLLESESTMGTSYPLRDLVLGSGQHRQQQLSITVPPWRQGGFSYRVESGEGDATLDLSAMSSGLALRLRFEATLHGPCSRCLEPAVVHVEVDAREVHDPDSGDDELVCDFVVEHDDLDLAAWASDAVGIQFPVRVLCSDDCKGLCPQCGANWNHERCECVQPVGDPRWAKLAELSLPDMPDPETPLH